MTGFKRTMVRVSSDLSIPNLKRVGSVLEDGLLGAVVGVRGRVPSGPYMEFNYDVSFGLPLYKAAGFHTQSPAVIVQISVEF